jgi:Protein of unknown function (DUF3040)
VPLSDHEQRVLEQMEQALYAEDPRFASNLKSTGQVTAARRRAAVGALVALAGLGMVILAVALQQIWVGGIGFAAMVLGGVWVFTPRPGPTKLAAVRPDGSVPPGKTGRKPKQRSSGSFMDRLEQRWDKRRGDGSL